MTIYVDDLFTMTPHTEEARKHGNQWCHLTTDGDIEELHKFAEKIGLRRAWFQPLSQPHYDLTPGKRALALQNGAVAKAIGDESTLRAKNIPSSDLNGAYELTQATAKAEERKNQPSVADFWALSPKEQYQVQKKLK